MKPKGTHISFAPSTLFLCAPVFVHLVCLSSQELWGLSVGRIVGCV